MKKIITLVLCLYAASSLHSMHSPNNQNTPPATHASNNISLSRCLKQPDVTSCGFYAFYHARSFLKRKRIKKDDFKTLSTIWKQLPNIPQKNLHGNHIDILAKHERLYDRIAVINSSTELEHLLNTNSIEDSKRNDIHEKIALLRSSNESKSRNKKRLTFIFQTSKEDKGDDLEKGAKKIGHWICLGFENVDNNIRMKVFNSLNPTGRGEPSEAMIKIYNFVSPPAPSEEEDDSSREENNNEQEVQPQQVIPQIERTIKINGKQTSLGDEDYSSEEEDTDNEEE